MASLSVEITPGRYVGVPEAEDDGELFEEKMERLVDELKNQVEEGRCLEQAIWHNLQELGYGG